MIEIKLSAWPVKILALTILALGLLNCNNAVEKINKVNKPDPKVDFQKNISGWWLDAETPICYRSHNFHRLQRTLKYENSGRYEYHVSFYDLADVDCSKEPVSRIIEKGTYYLGDIFTTKNTVPQQAYLIDYKPDSDGVIYEGDKFIVEIQYGTWSKNPTYDIIRYDNQRNLLLRTASFEEDIQRRPTELSWNLKRLDNLPPLYFNYQPTTSYLAPTIAELTGTWEKGCREEAHASTSGLPPLYKKWQLVFGANNVYQMTESIHNDSLCANNSLAAIQYNGTFSLGSSVMSSNVQPVSAAIFDFTLQSTNQTGDITGNDEHLNRLSINTTYYRLVAVTPNKGLLYDTSDFIKDSAIRSLELWSAYKKQ